MPTRIVVATAHAHADPFTDALQRRSDVEVLPVTPSRRDVLPGEPAARLSTAWPEVE